MPIVPCFPLKKSSRWRSSCNEMLSRRGSRGRGAMRASFQVGHEEVREGEQNRELAQNGSVEVQEHLAFEAREPCVDLRFGGHESCVDFRVESCEPSVDFRFGGREPCV